MGLTKDDGISAKEPSPPSPGGQRGAAVVFLVMMLAFVAILPTATQMISTSRDQTDQQAHFYAQADNVARAGLVDAIAWFRRQRVQPVATTVPYPDAAFQPLAAAGDTDDESIGLVREYPISQTSSLWARYEVKRVNDPSNPDPHAVRDITDKRFEGESAGRGLCWSLESLGYVYRRRDSAAPFNVAPNEIVARSRMGTEIRRLTMRLPVDAAVIVNNRDGVTLDFNGWITGGSAVGLGYYSGAGGSFGTNQLTGNPPHQLIPDGPLTPVAATRLIFGAPPRDIRLMADISVPDVASLPTNYPDMALVYVEGDATFDGVRQLRGGGVLYVNGNVTIQSGSQTRFNGLIFCTGNFQMDGPGQIHGTLFVLGNVRMAGMGDVAETLYDGQMNSTVRQQVGFYREHQAPKHFSRAF
jgi:hypothetical protein